MGFYFGKVTEVSVLKDADNNLQFFEKNRKMKLKDMENNDVH